MQCPFCQQEMGSAQTACPHCKRPHSPYVAYHLNKGWADLNRGADAEARSAFNEALRVTPSNDRRQLESYIAYLTRQAASSRLEAMRAQAPAPVAAVIPAVAPSSAPAARPAPQAAAPPRSPTVSAPVPTLQAGKASSEEASRGLFFNFNEKPVNIVRVMDEAKRQQMDYIRMRGKRIWIVPLLLIAGLIFVMLDAIIGYNFLTFSLVGYVLWGAALVAFIRFMRDRSIEFKTDLEKRPPRPGGGCLIVFFVVFFGIWAVAIGGAVITAVATISPVLVFTGLVLVAALVSVILLLRSQPKGKQFGPKFDMARTIFETIKDDLAPKRTLIGWLDLTGPQPGKIILKRTSLTGMPIHYYRDEWLKMKMVLYDGNVMRVTALERIKARMGRWKRKGRWKPGSSASRHELRIAITVNREAYEAQPLRASQFGKFMVDARASDDGRIVLEAQTDAAINATDILQILRFAYEHLKPHTASATV